MKSIGLPFCGQLVPKVLDGSKTMTRRLPNMQNCRLLNAKHEDVTGAMRDVDWRHVQKTEDNCIVVFSQEHNEWLHLVPRHKPGDVAWMRENLRPNSIGTTAIYAADGMPVMLDGVSVDWPEGKKVIPSIHMHRKYSRKELVLTGVRIELIQDISEEDAIAEGITLSKRTCTMYDRIHAHRFAELWDSLNASRGWGWDTNRPVVVYDWAPPVDTSAVGIADLNRRFVDALSPEDKKAMGDSAAQVISTLCSGEEK